MNMVYLVMRKEISPVAALPTLVAAYQKKVNAEERREEERMEAHINGHTGFHYFIQPIQVLDAD
jgi:hypothetical protein